MTELAGHYDAGLVVVSIAAAMVSSYVALSMVPRIYDTSASPRATLFWTLVFGVSMGAGIWTMHFIAMLAFSLPVPVYYDPWLTIVSMLVAVGFASAGAWPLRRGGVLAGARLFSLGTLLGLGIAGMHYTGMAAMRMNATHTYDGALVAVSVVIAIVASIAALWLANRIRQGSVFGEIGLKIPAAVVMGLAVSGMHYTGMAAVHFYVQAGQSGPLTGLDTFPLAIMLAIVAALVQGGVLVTAAQDEARLALRRQLNLESRLGSMLEAMPDAVFSIDATGVIDRANPAASALFGYEPEQFTGMSIHDLAPADIRDAHRRWAEDEVAGRRHSVIGRIREIRAQRKDGSTFPCEISISRYGEADAPRFTVVVRDVSARKQAEEQLERQNRMGAGLNRLLTIAMDESPLEQRIREALDCIIDQQWLGVSPRGAVFVAREDKLEMVSSRGLGGLAERCAHLDAGECLCGTVFENGTPLETAHLGPEHTTRAADMEDHGHVIWPMQIGDQTLGVLNLYLDAGQALMDDERAFVGSCAHVLAQMVFREQAVLAMRRLETAIDQAPEGVLITDHDGRIVYANPAVAAIAGRPREELIGRHAAQVRGGVKGDGLFTEIMEHMDDGRPWQGDIECTRPDGEKRIIERHIAPVIVGGETHWLVCVDTDVTEQRESQKRLEHTQRLESLGVLAGGIAHDFNNILATIMGNAGLARMKGGVKGDALIYLQRIEEASQRAADLCKQMLAYSGKGQFVVKPIDLSDMVREITKLLEVSIAKNVVLKFHLAENLPVVEADTAQLQQVIMNLVINASEAIGENSGVISLSTGMMHADEAYLKGAYVAEGIRPGRFVYLEVADTGCGMSSDVIKQLFDPFFTTKFTGRGLGMSAVLGIVRGHHGAIKVYSEPGQGTTFKILLPASDASDKTGKKQEEEQSGWCGVGTVLVVDDEETIRETAGAMLQALGFEVLTAADGEEGVEVYRAHQDQIVAVLLDMTMPKLDGKGCFRELRRINPAVRVILSSGYNELDATSRFAGQGLAGFIQKPYAPEALHDVLRRALG